MSDLSQSVGLGEDFSSCVAMVGCVAIRLLASMTKNRIMSRDKARDLAIE